MKRQTIGFISPCYYTFLQQIVRDCMQYVFCSCCHKNVLMLNTALRSVSKVPCICFLFVLWNSILLHEFCNVIYRKTQKGSVTVIYWWFNGHLLNLSVTIGNVFVCWSCRIPSIVVSFLLLHDLTLLYFIIGCQILWNLFFMLRNVYSDCMAPHNVVMGQERKYWMLRQCFVSVC